MPVRRASSCWETRAAKRNVRMRSPRVAVLRVTIHLGHQTRSPLGIAPFEATISAWHAPHRRTPNNSSSSRSAVSISRCRRRRMRRQRRLSDVTSMRPREFFI